MNLAILAELLLVTAAAARIPSIGHDSIATWLDLAARLIKSGDKAEAALVELKEQIEAMVAEGRDPTPEEWAELKRRSDDAHSRIQDWSPERPRGLS